MFCNTILVSSKFINIVVNEKNMYFKCNIKTRLVLTDCLYLHNLYIKGNGVLN